MASVCTSCYRFNDNPGATETCPYCGCKTVEEFTCAKDQVEKYFAQLNPTEMGWLLQHRNQQEIVFYQRINFFLIAEAMLIAAFATLATAELKLPFVVLVVNSLGLAMTFLWLLANHRQLRVFRQIRKFTSERWLLYRRGAGAPKLMSQPLLDRLPRWIRWLPESLLSGQKLLAYWVPGIILFTWIMLGCGFIGDWIPH